MSRPTTKTTSQALLCILYLLLVAKIGQHKKWQVIIAKNNWILRGKADSTETNSNLRIQVTVICILNRFNFWETNEETEYPIQKLLSSRGDVKPPKPLANQTLVLNHEMASNKFLYNTRLEVWTSFITWFLCQIWLIAKQHSKLAKQHWKPKTQMIQTMKFWKPHKTTAAQ